MFSSFNSLETEWPFTANSDFVCFAKIGNDNCPIVNMEILTELSKPYEINIVVLSSKELNSSYAENQQSIQISLFPHNQTLFKCFSGNIVSVQFQGTAFNLVESLNSSEKSLNNVYLLKLRPYSWNATHKNKIVIYHDTTKHKLVEKILLPYKISNLHNFEGADSKQCEVITQYLETDFNFSIRLIEESNCFAYYDFYEQDPKFKIRNSKEVSSSVKIKKELELVTEIHDNFNFNQILDLRYSSDAISDVYLEKNEIFKKSKIDELVNPIFEEEKNTFYTHFSCQCSSYNLFAGDYFSVTSKSSNVFLVSPFNLNQNFFIEKAKLILSYDSKFGWYIRNYLEGFVFQSSIPEYRLKRTTSSPRLKGPQKAYVCGEVKNSLYVNSEGKLKVRFTWIPLDSQNTAEQKIKQTEARLEAKLNKEKYLLSLETSNKIKDEANELALKAALEGADIAFDKINSGINFGQDKLKDMAISGGNSFVSDLSSGDLSNSGKSAADLGLTDVGAGIGLGLSQAGKLVMNEISDITKDGLKSMVENAKTEREDQLANDKKYILDEDFLQDSSAIWSVENSDNRALSGWVPLGQWGGSGDGFGNYSFPRVGQEVIVFFFDDNPDKPFISETVFSLNNPYPFAKVSSDDLDKKKSGSSILPNANADSVQDSLNDIPKTPSQFIDSLEGISVPNLDDYEQDNIASSSGNTIIRSYSYDDQNRTNRAGWNEISFFNKRYKESMRIRSAHYMFLQSRNIINVEAPKLLRQNIGIYYSNVIGNFYNLISGKTNEFYGKDRVSYFAGNLGCSSTGVNDGMVANRLQVEVASKLSSQLARFSGKQIYSVVMNNGLHLFLSFLGDYALIVLGGLIEMTTLGAFNVNCNLSNFIILGKWNVSVAGFADFIVGGRFNVTSSGKITFDTARSFHVDSLHRITLTSVDEISLNAALGDFSVKSGGKISLFSGKGFNINSTQMSIKTGKLNIDAASISINTASGLSVKTSQCSFDAMKFDVKGMMVTLSGAIVKLG